MASRARSPTLFSRLIIENAITPRFRAGDFPGGITRGVDDIISVLTGDAAEWQQRAAKRPEPTTRWDSLLVMLFVVVVVVVLYSSRSSAPSRETAVAAARAAARRAAGPPGRARPGPPALPAGSPMVAVFPAVAARSAAAGRQEAGEGLEMISQVDKDRIADAITAGRDQDLGRDLLRHRAPRRATIAWCRWRGRRPSRSPCRHR